MVETSGKYRSKQSAHAFIYRQSHIECQQILTEKTSSQRETTRNVHELDFIDQCFLTVDIQELSWITPTFRCYPANKKPVVETQKKTVFSSVFLAGTIVALCYLLGTVQAVPE